jgi:hypothetical protein
MSEIERPCEKHPDKEGVYFCAKYNRYLCAACMACADPNLFCKHRTSCIIHELEKYPDQVVEASDGSPCN